MYQCHVVSSMIVIFPQKLTNVSVILVLTGRPALISWMVTSVPVSKVIMERIVEMVIYQSNYVIIPHYEPPRQNVTIVSQICLILVSNCLKDLNFVSNMSRTKCLNLVSIWDLFDIWDAIETVPIWEQFETFFCVVKKVSKRSQKVLKKGFGGI